MTDFYSGSHRAFQDEFDTRRLADTLYDNIVRSTLAPMDRKFITASDFFFLSTIDHNGFPTVSYKGGLPGFVKILGDGMLAFPAYDGNGMFRSLGNIEETGKVALLFIRQNDNANRIRIHGTGRVLLDESDLSQFEGAEAVVEVQVSRVFPNCPRYIHDLESGTISEFAPGGSTPPPEPEWKQWDTFADVLPNQHHT